MRYTKEMAKDLIGFAKTIKFRFNYWDARSNSGFEFCRQMSSPNLQKINPNFKVDFAYQEQDTQDPPIMKAEFSDGSVLELNTTDHHAQDLRGLFYDHAAMVSERSETTDDKEESPDIVLSTASFDAYNQFMKERNMDTLPFLSKNEIKKN